MRVRSSLVAVALLVPLAGRAAAVEELVDGIAAQVGSDVVLLSEVTEITAPIENRMREVDAPVSEIAKLRAEVLDRLIERRLIEQLVRRAEIGASDVEVDGAIAQIAEENGLTFEQLVESVEAQGLDYTSYREQIRAEIQRTKVLNGIIGSRVRVEDEEVRELYRERFDEQPSSGEEIHLRHILVTFRGDTGDDVRAARERAEGALDRVRAGESFAQVAREVSDAGRAEGGDVGWLHADALASWMASAVAALQPGETSDVIRTDFGYNLLHVVDRREFSKPSFDQVGAALERELYNRKLEEEYEEWIEKLRSQTFIERKGLFADATRLRLKDADADDGESEGERFESLGLGGP